MERLVQSVHRNGSVGQECLQERRVGTAYLQDWGDWSKVSWIGEFGQGWMQERRVDSEWFAEEGWLVNNV